MKMKLQTVTLGCSKNKVDTEHILSHPFFEAPNGPGGCQKAGGQCIALKTELQHVAKLDAT